LPNFVGIFRSGRRREGEVEKIDGTVVEAKELDVEAGRKDGSDEAGDEVRRKK